MRIHRHLLVTAALLVCAAGTATAQDKGKVGVTTGFPAAIGIQWHVSDKVAFRPEVSFARSTSESSGNSFSNEGSTWNVGTNVSVLFYMRSDDKLRTYFAPRLSWSRVSTTGTSSGVTTFTSKTTGTAVGGAGSFGAQYSLSDKFVVFGELGLSYAHSSTEPSVSSTKATGNAWGTRTAVGIVFFP